MNKKRPIHQYSEQSLASALEAVKNGTSIRSASREFGVPKTTIQDRISGRIKEGPRKMGPQTVLSLEEESILVKWLKQLATTGFPQKKTDLQNAVQKIILENKRETPFKDGRPGEKWYSGFLKRHPDLVLREPEGLTKSRAIITEEFIRKWFQDLNEFINEKGIQDIFTDPRRVLNGDETSFSMCPKTGKVLAPKGWKNVYELKKGNEKEAITVLLVFSAAGGTAFPMVVFPYIRPPASVVKTIPEKWYLGRSETGWMRSEVFYEYIVNGVNEWILMNNIPKPVILFIDGHKSHLTLHLSKWCDENDIILYALPPNTTHIMQPADVSVFKPLKTQWKKTVRDWQSKPENSNKVLNKNSFCPLLQECLESPFLPQSIINGFKRCGIYPLDPDAVDYTKCIQNDLENNKNTDQLEITDQEIEIAKKVLRATREKLLLQNIDSNRIITALEDIYRNRLDVHENFILIESNNMLLPANETDYELPEFAMSNSELEFDIANMSIDILDGETYDTSNIEKQKENEKESINIDHEALNPDHEISLPINTEENNNEGMNAEETESSQEWNAEETEKITDVIQNVLTEKQQRNTDDTSERGEKHGDNEGRLLTNDECTPSSSGISGRKSFGDHLWWPGPLETQRKMAKEKLPSAISSAAYRQFLEEKENLKKIEQEKKEKRKLMRKQKIEEKTLVKKQSKLKKKPKGNNKKTEKNKGDEQQKIDDGRENDEEDEDEKENEDISRILCSACDEELISDIEEDDLKNVGCDRCIRWFHLMCTEFVGLPYDEVVERDFTCSYCS